MAPSALRGLPPHSPFCKVHSPLMLLAPGTVIGGKYRIERALARGGMGSVWVARHVQLGSEVALKFLDPSFAASAAHRTRFEREARAAANLKSPHVVHVSDYGFEGTAPYLVMELLEGEDLGQRLHRIGRMTIPDTARVLAQVGKALRKAHEAGIAHRDLKPANLFLARIDDEEVVKVLDFGIAKESGAALGDATKTGEVMGSPHYMSPEQVRAEKDLDYRTDLWALGVIVYRMLVGELPFPGDQLGPVLAKILTAPIPAPTQVAPDLPPTIDGFVARALARDKAQRFQTVGEMVEAFQVAAGQHAGAPGTTAVLSPAVTAGIAALRGDGTQSVAGKSDSHGVAGQSGSSTSPGNTNAGLAGTRSTAKPKSMGLALAIGFAILGVAAPVIFFVVSSSTSDPAGAAGSGAIVAPVTAEVAPSAPAVAVIPSSLTDPPSGSPSATVAPTVTASTPQPTPSPRSTSSTQPEPAASVTATSTPTTTKPTPTATPAGTQKKLEEKWW